MAELHDISDAITEFNRSYLMLAKWLLLANRDEATRQLGISEKTASRIAALTLAQIDHLARAANCSASFATSVRQGARESAERRFAPRHRDDFVNDRRYVLAASRHLEP
ncbi:hypothetical protein NLI96_g13397 [Meripilus lineatus]|uniref:Flagellar transcriptional regulator FlhD n=1 Tax=Meripilus lineatus TaxID=2056292 RepID=A0AAD5UN46_9APHY|nr:hypothetical protein NLI96_g13397 [Physisporinus lineatus]